MGGYWDQLGRDASRSELGAVCYAGAPPLLNRYAAWSQRLAVDRLLRLAGPLDGARALDVGCGTGRWSRLLAERGAEVTGIDASEAMLAEARRRSPGLDLQVGDAAALDLPDDRFDLAVAVTVLQHLEPQRQELAVRELARVVRPGGHILVVDRAGAPTEFAARHLTHPRKREEWLALWREAGAMPVAVRGQEFSYPLRLAGLARRSAAPPEAAPTIPQRRGSAGWRRRALELLVVASFAIEAVAANLAPRAPAEHMAALLRVNGG